MSTPQHSRRPTVRFGPDWIDFAHQIFRVENEKLEAPEETETVILGISNSIFDSWNQLRRVHAGYGETIQKRWRKKSSSQRQASLLSAWKGMPQQHHPDFHHFLERSYHDMARHKKQKKATPFQAKPEAYKWPYINLQDLQDPQSILFMIGSRARNPPDVFSQTDFHATRFGQRAGALTWQNVPNYGMNFAGCHEAATYGQLVPLLDGSEYDMRQKQKMIVTVGEGMVILEVQDRLYKFLVDICRSVLHDLPLNKWLNIEETTSLPATLMDSDTNSWSIKYSPYRSPRDLNLEGMASLLAIKKEWAESHIRALREEPQYFVSIYHEWEAHGGQPVSEETELIKEQEDAPWMQKIHIVIRRLVLYNISHLEIWGHLLASMTEVIELQRHATTSHDNHEASEEFRTALFMLSCQLKMFLHILAPILACHFAQSPSIRDCFTVRGDGGVVRFFPSTPYSKGRDEIAWILGVVATEFNHRYGNIYTVSADLLSNIDLLMKADNTLKHHLSSMVFRELSDVAFLAECVQEIERYQLSTCTFISDEDPLRAVADDELLQIALKTCLYKVPVLTNRIISELGNPFGGKFAWPDLHHQAREHVEQRRCAERNLAVFWTIVDEFMEGFNWESYPEHYRKLRSDRTVHRTPPFVEDMLSQDASEATGTVAAEQFSHTTGSEGISDQLAELTLQTEADPEETDKPKIKIKTRGIPHPENQPEEVPDEPLEPTPAPVFQVDRRSLKVFATLFHTLGTQQAGEVKWNDFLHAMVCVGFGVVKLHGSAWQFTPGDAVEGHPIQFHEPHPEDKMLFQVARRIGRRLTRTYGWNSDSFTLRGR